LIGFSDWPLRPHARMSAAMRERVADGSGSNAGGCATRGGHLLGLQFLSCSSLMLLHMPIMAATPSGTERAQQPQCAPHPSGAGCPRRRRGPFRTIAYRRKRAKPGTAQVRRVYVARTARSERSAAARGTGGEGPRLTTGLPCRGSARPYGST
jgi:hypothetical protein